LRDKTTWHGFEYGVDVGVGWLSDDVRIPADCIRILGFPDLLVEQPESLFDQHGQLQTRIDGNPIELLKYGNTTRKSIVRSGSIIINYLLRKLTRAYSSIGSRCCPPSASKGHLDTNQARNGAASTPDSDCSGWSRLLEPW